MKHPLVIYIIACLWCWGTLAPLRGVPLWVLLSGESDSGPAPNPINNAVFGGSQYLRTSTMTGLTDGKTGTVSFWYKCNGGDGTQRFLFHVSSGSGGYRFLIRHLTTNILSFEGYRTGDGTQCLRMRVATAITAGSEWMHVMACWDLANSSNKAIYYDGISQTIDSGTLIFTNDTIDYNSNLPRLNVGANGADTAAEFITGALGEFWFNDSYNNVIGDYYNTGKAVPLGSNGEIPTGSSPVLYLSSSGSGNSWNNNGAAGALMRTGTLTTDGDPPDWE